MCMGIDSSGNVLVWGSSKDGLLGLGYDITSVDIPTKLESLKDIMEISMSDNHAVAISSIGEAFSWGTGKYGELGLDKSIYTPTPLRMTNDKIYTKVFCGNLITCLLDANGHFSYFGVIIKVLKGINSTITVKSLLNDISVSDPKSLFLEKIIVELENEQFNSIVIGNGFIGLLSKKGTVFTLEYSDKLTMLYSKHFVYSITVAHNDIFGLSIEKTNTNNIIPKNNAQVSSYQKSDSMKDSTGNANNQQKNYYLCQWNSKFQEKEVSSEIWHTTIYKISEDVHIQNLNLLSSNGNKGLILLMEKDVGGGLNSSFFSPVARKSLDSNDISWDNITYNELPSNISRKGHSIDNFLILDSEFDDSYNMKFKRSKSQSSINIGLNRGSRSLSPYLSKTLNTTLMNPSNNAMHRSNTNLSCIIPKTNMNDIKTSSISANIGNNGNKGNNLISTIESGGGIVVTNNNDNVNYYDESIDMKEKELQTYKKEIDDIITNFRLRQREQRSSLKNKYNNIAGNKNNTTFTKNNDISQTTKSNHYRVQSSDLNLSFSSDLKKQYLNANTTPNNKKNSTTSKVKFLSIDKALENKSNLDGRLDTSNINIETKNEIASDLEGFLNKTNNMDNSNIKNDLYSDLDDNNNSNLLFDECSQIKQSGAKGNFLSPNNNMHLNKRYIFTGTNNNGTTSPSLIMIKSTPLIRSNYREDDELLGRLILSTSYNWLNNRRCHSERIKYNKGLTEIDDNQLIKRNLSEGNRKAFLKGKVVVANFESRLAKGLRGLYFGDLLSEEFSTMNRKGGNTINKSSNSLKTSKGNNELASSGNYKRVFSNAGTNNNILDDFEERNKKIYNPLQRNRNNGNLLDSNYNTITNIKSIKNNESINSNEQLYEDTPKFEKSGPTNSNNSKNQLNKNVNIKDFNETYLQPKNASQTIHNNKNMNIKLIKNPTQQEKSSHTLIENFRKIIIDNNNATSNKITSHNQQQSKSYNTCPQAKNVIKKILLQYQIKPSLLDENELSSNTLTKTSLNMNSNSVIKRTIRKTKSLNASNNQKKKRTSHHKKGKVKQYSHENNISSDEYSNNRNSYYSCNINGNNLGNEHEIRLIQDRQQHKSNTLYNFNNNNNISNRDSSGSNHNINSSLFKKKGSDLSVSRDSSSNYRDNSPRLNVGGNGKHTKNARKGSKKYENESDDASRKLSNTSRSNHKEINSLSSKLVNKSNYKENINDNEEESNNSMLPENLNKNINKYNHGKNVKVKNDSGYYHDDEDADESGNVVNDNNNNIINNNVDNDNTKHRSKGSKHKRNNSHQFITGLDDIVTNDNKNMVNNEGNSPTFKQINANIQDIKNFPKQKVNEDNNRKNNEISEDDKENLQKLGNNYKALTNLEQYNNNIVSNKLTNDNIKNQKRNNFESIENLTSGTLSNNINASVKTKSKNLEIDNINYPFMTTTTKKNVSSTSEINNITNSSNTFGKGNDLQYSNNSNDCDLMFSFDPNSMQKQLMQNKLKEQITKTSISGSNSKIGKISQQDLINAIQEEEPKKLKKKNGNKGNEDEIDNENEILEYNRKKGKKQIGKRKDDEEKESDEYDENENVHKNKKRKQNNKNLDSYDQDEYENEEEDESNENKEKEKKRTKKTKHPYNEGDDDNENEEDNENGTKINNNRKRRKTNKKQQETASEEESEESETLTGKKRRTKDKNEKKGKQDIIYNDEDEEEEENETYPPEKINKKGKRKSNTKDNDDGNDESYENDILNEEKNRNRKNNKNRQNTNEEFDDAQGDEDENYSKKKYNKKTYKNKVNNNNEEEGEQSEEDDDFEEKGKIKKNKTKMNTKFNKANNKEEEEEDKESEPEYENEKIKGGKQKNRNKPLNSKQIQNNNEQDDNFNEENEEEDEIEDNSKANDHKKYNQKGNNKKKNHNIDENNDSEEYEKKKIKNDKMRVNNEEEEDNDEESDEEGQKHARKTKTKKNLKMHKKENRKVDDEEGEVSDEDEDSNNFQNRKKTKNKQNLKNGSKNLEIEGNEELNDIEANENIINNNNNNYKGNSNNSKSAEDKRNSKKGKKIIDGIQGKTNSIADDSGEEEEQEESDNQFKDNNPRLKRNSKSQKQQNNKKKNEKRRANKHNQENEEIEVEEEEQESDEDETNEDIKNKKIKNKNLTKNRSSKSGSKINKSNNSNDEEEESENEGVGGLEKKKKNTKTINSRARTFDVTKRDEEEDSGVNDSNEDDINNNHEKRKSISKINNNYRHKRSKTNDGLNYNDNGIEGKSNSKKASHKNSRRISRHRSEGYNDVEYILDDEGNVHHKVKPTGKNKGPKRKFQYKDTENEDEEEGEEDNESVENENIQEKNKKNQKNSKKTKKDRNIKNESNESEEEEEQEEDDIEQNETSKNKKRKKKISERKSSTKVKKNSLAGEENDIDLLDKEKNAGDNLQNNQIKNQKLIEIKSTLSQRENKNQYKNEIIKQGSENRKDNEEMEGDEKQKKFSKDKEKYQTKVSRKYQNEEEFENDSENNDGNEMLNVLDNSKISLGNKENLSNKYSKGKQSKKNLKQVEVNDDQLENLNQSGNEIYQGGFTHSDLISGNGSQLSKDKFLQIQNKQSLIQNYTNNTNDLQNNLNSNSYGINNKRIFSTKNNSSVTKLNAQYNPELENYQNNKNINSLNENIQNNENKSASKSSYFNSLEERGMDSSSLDQNTSNHFNANSSYLPLSIKKQSNKSGSDSLEYSYSNQYSSIAKIKKASNPNDTTSFSGNLSNNRVPSLPINNPNMIISPEDTFGINESITDKDLSINLKGKLYHTNQKKSSLSIKIPDEDSHISSLSKKKLSDTKPKEVNEVKKREIKNNKKNKEQDSEDDANVYTFSNNKHKTSKDNIDSYSEASDANKKIIDKKSKSNVNYKKSKGNKGKDIINYPMKYMDHNKSVNFQIQHENKNLVYLVSESSEKKPKKTMINKYTLSYFEYLILNYMRKKSCLLCLDCILRYQIKKEKGYACKILFRVIKKRMIFYEIKFYHRLVKIYKFLLKYKK